jgi:pyruvate-ferredoxin/flavodoxin oxidoreductase
MSETYLTVDANEAVASVAHRLSEVIAIYPITPSSAMGELADEWAAAGKQNIWGQVPKVVEMQSEAGAAGAVHGSLQAGALTTTFTASQGLLLMLPDMLKIAGELTPFCMHVAARAVASHALSIFGDHSDVMMARTTGFVQLCSSSVQEAQDLALVSHAATLKARLPILHFFDGFRTSHEVSRISPLGDDVLRAMMDDGAIAAIRSRKLTPDHPVLRGTAQNPDVFFQAREACNSFYAACPAIVQATMDEFAKLTGRHYKLFDYYGDPKAERVIVMMGSGSEAAREAVEWMNEKGEKVGLVVIRLFRPFDFTAFAASLPATVKSVAVLDRTKEPGAPGEPMYQDVVTTLAELGRSVKVVGGRYGLSSKEFTPAMVRAVYDNLSKPQPKNHFTVGINDDVTHTSLSYDGEFDLEPNEVVRALFFGLGSDGTVSSNKQVIKIIGQETDHTAQGYFVYDSKKSGAMTVSHLRFGTKPIRSSYLIRHANFIACHYAPLMDRQDVLEAAAEGSVFLLNTHHPADVAFSKLTVDAQETIIKKKMKFYVIDAFAVAKDAGLDRYISTVMQVCFFKLSAVLPMDEALEHIRHGIEKAYGKRGAEVVKRNFAAVDGALARLFEVKVPTKANGIVRHAAVPKQAPDFVQRVTAMMLEGKGDLLPVSAFPVDGTWPTATTQWEKRGIGLEIPRWDQSLCIQCNKCSLICPHASIRSQLVDPDALGTAPSTFLTTDFKSKDFGTAPSGKTWKYSLQVAPDDCTGCGLCVAVCPARDKSNPKHKAIDMADVEGFRDAERANWSFFDTLPYIDRTGVKDDLKASQFLEPLFEFSGACSGCGETPYLKLVSQLFGDRMVVANATGCTSIYGGNLPTTPWAQDKNGRGPAWANSLFEDNAEFGLGMRLGVDAQQTLAQSLLKSFASDVGDELVTALLSAKMDDEAGITEQRARVVALRKKLEGNTKPDAKKLVQLADSLVRKSVWIVGGDGWAYDIGYGGLDHVLATGADVNVLVLDTEVYSNTGGQASKATPLGASAKFAAAGKAMGKKDLGLLAMSYGHVYVASIAMGSKDAQTLKALREAESYRGPSLIIAYSHCIAHGYDMERGAEQQKLAVDSGVWPLYRFDPRRLATGEAPLQLDAGAPKMKPRDYMKNEGRFRMVALRDPKRFDMLVEQAEEFAARRRSVYEQLAGVHVTANKGNA